MGRSVGRSRLLKVLAGVTSCDRVLAGVARCESEWIEGCVDGRRLDGRVNGRWTVILDGRLQGRWNGILGGRLKGS